MVVENYNFLCTSFFFANNILTGETKHSASKESNGAMNASCINIIWKVNYPLRFIVGYVWPIKQQYESEVPL